MAKARTDPLVSTEPIVDKDGKPTVYFLRQWERQTEVNSEVSNLDGVVFNAGTGLDGGGVLGTTDPIAFALDDTAVTPGTYGDGLNVAQVTVDQQGRLTSVLDVAITGGGGGGSGSLSYQGSYVVETPGDANIDFLLDIDFDAYKILIRGLTGPSNTQIYSRMSVDGGATFEAASDAYKNSHDNSDSNIGMNDGVTVGAARPFLGSYDLWVDHSGVVPFNLTGTSFSATSTGANSPSLSGGYPQATFASGNYAANFMQVVVAAGDADDLVVEVWGLAKSTSVPSIVLGSGGKFAPPLSTDFPTWVNQQAGVITDDAYAGMTLTDPTSDPNADSFICRVKPMPTGNWVATFQYNAWFVAANFNGVGFIMRDSSTNRNIVFRRLYNSGNTINVATYANNTFDSTLYNIATEDHPFWFQVEDDGTNFFFRQSLDGITWQTVASPLRTAWLATPDQIGFMVDPESIAGIGCNVTYYDDKDTPAVLPVVPGVTYDIAGQYGGTPAVSTIIFRHLDGRPFTLPAGLTGSVGYATTVPTADTAFDIQLNSVSVGTMTFANATNVATFIMATDTNLVSGDRLDIVSPAALNNIADLAFTLLGNA